MFKQTEVCAKAQLTPAAICWTATSKLHVTCAQGFLLLVDPESLHVSVQFDPSCKISTHTVGLFIKVGLPVTMLLTPVFVQAAAEAIPELTQDTFRGLTLWKNDCIAVGMVNIHNYNYVVSSSGILTTTGKCIFVFILYRRVLCTVCKSEELRLKS